jgi:hypothetical protein
MRLRLPGTGQRVAEALYLEMTMVSDSGTISSYVAPHQMTKSASWEVQSLARAVDLFVDQHGVEAVARDDCLEVLMRRIYALLVAPKVTWAVAGQFLEGAGGPSHLLGGSLLQQGLRVSKMSLEFEGLRDKEARRRAANPGD